MTKSWMITCLASSVTNRIKIEHIIKASQYGALFMFDNYIKCIRKEQPLLIALMFDKSVGLVRKWSEIRVGLIAA